MGHTSGSEAPGPDHETVGGRYRLVTLTATAPAGPVWLGHDDLLDRWVAVQQIDPPAGASSGEILTMQLDTMRDAQALTRLDHPGIVGVSDVIWSPDRCWMVLEYVTSRPLSDLVRQEGPLDDRSAAWVGLSALRSLSAAHRVGVLHGGLTPAVVLLVDNGRIMLTGFAVAAAGAGEAAAAAQFIAPEQRRTRQRSAEADLWSLGAILRAVRGGPEPAEDPQPVGPHPVKRPGRLDPVIDGLLVEDPARRLTAWQAEQALAAIIERAVGVSSVPPLAGQPALGAASPSAPDHPAPPPARALGSPAGSADAARPSWPPDRIGSRVRRIRRRIGVAAVAVLLVAGIAAALTVRDVISPQTTPDNGRSGVPAPARAICGDPPTGGEPLTPVPAEQPSALPDGWVRHGESAFQAVLPAGWLRFADGGAVCFRDPDGDRTFGVDTTVPTTRQPLGYWQAAERSAIGGGTLPGYAKISMRTVDLRDGGADWEYTWSPPSGGRQQVRRLLLRTDAERASVLQWTGRADQWAAGEGDRNLMITSFTRIR